MLFDKSYEVEEILDENVNEEELVEFAKEQELNPKMDNTNKWYIYSMKYGVDNGLDIITAQSFADTVTSLITGLRINTAANFYKQEKVMDNIIWGFLHEAYMYEPTPDDFKDIFESIFTEYDENADEYTYKTEQVLLKISIPLKTRFLEVPGTTYSEKLITLLDNFENKNK